ncbi:MAG TPA: trigger factor [Candidatus Paceibacterota bacterium]
MDIKDVKINKLNETEIEITGEITRETFEKYREESEKYLGASLNLDGFRKGHVPVSVMKERLGPMVILEEMAERALREIYPNIIMENKIEAIDRPHISITKIAEGSPLGYKIRQTILPIFDLPEYKKIAKEVNKKLDSEDKGNAVTDEELNKVVEDITKARKESNSEKGDLTDEEKSNVRANMQQDKDLRARDKRRMAIVDGLLADTKIIVPSVLIEKQMDRFMNEMKGNLENMRLSWEDYLKHTKKTEAEVREGGRSDAEKRVKTELLLAELAKAEKIEPDEAELEKEVANILSQHKNADPEGVRDYVAGIMRNTKVFELLENLK